MYSRRINQEKNNDGQEYKIERLEYKIERLEYKIERLESNPPTEQQSLVERIWDNKEDEFWETL